MLFPAGRNILWNRSLELKKQQQQQPVIFFFSTEFTQKLYLSVLVRTYNSPDDCEDL